MSKRFLLILSVLCSLLFFACTPSVRDSKTTYARDALKPFVDSGQLPGAISVFYKDGVQETCCIGYADVAKKRPIRMDNAFMQCSQTKGFCGVTIAKLIEEGRLSLDDPVSKYLPEFKTLWVLDSEKDGIQTLHRAKNVLTIRMVLNHTGGFPFEISAKRRDVKGGGWSGGAPIRQVASIAAASPLLFEPGAAVRYSNTGIDIGAAVVEVITGMKWEQYLKQVVLDPLDMKSTWFWPSDRQIRNKIELYEYVDDAPAIWREEMAWEQRPYNDSHVFASAGAGLWTTANDQLKFYKMLMNLGLGDNGVRILNEETVKSLLAVSSRPEELGGYSLGLEAPVQDSEDAWIGHGGAWGTNCIVNWHRKQLKLWVVQRAGGKEPWKPAVEEAAKTFFAQDFINSHVDEYTGRTDDPIAVCFGEVRPDRMDDLIWENEFSGYRAFGPALQAAGETAYGYDIFTKSVTHLVMHERYNKNMAQGDEYRSFHIDHGDGMDSYAVGPTLGGGTAALVDVAGIVYPWCWKEAEILENGPLRFQARLTYSPVKVGGKDVTEHRVITLDSGHRLNRVDITYEGLEKPTPIVVGIVVHAENSSGWYADDHVLAVADLGDRNIGENGEIYCGALLPEGFDHSGFEQFDTPKGSAIGHILGYSTYYPGKTFTYYFGSGWSKAGITSLDDWICLITKQSSSISKQK